MTTNDECADAGSVASIDTGDSYDHAEHDRVEVVAIWEGTDSLDVARDDGQAPPVVVRYTTESDGTSANEHTATIAAFLDAVECWEDGECADDGDD